MENKLFQNNFGYQGNWAKNADDELELNNKIEDIYRKGKKDLKYAPNRDMLIKAYKIYTSPDNGDGYYHDDEYYTDVGRADNIQSIYNQLTRKEGNKNGK